MKPESRVIRPKSDRTIGDGTSTDVSLIVRFVWITNVEVNNFHEEKFYFTD